MNIRTNRMLALALSGVLGAGTLAVPTASIAQSSFIHRHHRAAGAAAGIAAYEASKKTGRARAMRGQHRNFAQRHPFITGAAAAAVTNHYAKRHR